MIKRINILMKNKNKNKNSITSKTKNNIISFPSNISKLERQDRGSFIFCC